ncbi:uncharacterized protein LOC131232306 [Magnolia sinica]|uniref:uncharacterized protein LOC131232306 n=1 Tax=Magnolia sinica TaxID=86752 RepID=UPI00265952CF|nr:uncharacterized protein LOC131232306 [Magnolia sinica]
MGNCMFRGFAEVNEVIKVVTSNGGVMELYGPITAECITNEFPGHGIFRGPDHFSPRLLHSDELAIGELYYLLPIRHQRSRIAPDNEGDTVRMQGVRSVVAPYRMSFDNNGIFRRAETEVLTRYNNAGVWKVKLVISPEQLTEILSQEARTEALIESVRTVAKCGSGYPSSSSSDQWSMASSWKGTSENVG